MDDTQENDYEERLKEVFNSFNTSGTGCLYLEEVSDLCQSLHLGDATPDLLHALLQNQDPLTARVDFEQFKNALILVLSATIESSQTEQETLPKPETSEIQPKFVNGRKHYGRRSTPEFIEPISDFCEIAHEKLTEDGDQEDNDDSAVPRKRERWNAHDTSSEEFEAEGQMQLWNPDEPSTPQGSIITLSGCLEERISEACEELGIVWEGCASQTELRALCQHLDLEIKGDLLQSLSDSGVMNVQEFVSRLVNHNKPPTPSASTPYRQLKRHHSTQPFDEGGRRLTTPAAMTSTIGLRLFSTLDDGTGYTAVECILDAWMEEGIENCTEILQALNFNINGKVSLGDLTMALENELLLTKNGIHQAALVSFKAEIRHLLERVDRELGEKEKIRSDLEKAEKLKTQLAAEVDEHHSAIEQMNNLNIRKLEQDHKDKRAAIRSELMKEMDQIQQQAGLQREELEAEIEKIREDESFLRDHLSISVKENRRLETELLDSTEKLLQAQNQIEKLQSTLDNIMKERFGDLDPGSADFFFQEDRIKQLRSSYEAQCRELQDRIDELQSELQDFHVLGRSHQPCHKPLSEDLESQSPGMESDQGIGSEEVQPFSMSLEVEMMLEQLKEQHFQEKEELQRLLETKITEFNETLEKQREAHEGHTVALTLQHEQEVQTLRERMATFESHAEALQSQLEQADLERASLEQKQAEEKEELKKRQENELESLKRELLGTNTSIADLQQQLKTFEVQEIETAKNHTYEIEKLREAHAVEIKELEGKYVKLLEVRLEEERKKLQDERSELEIRSSAKCEREKELLKHNYEEQLKARLEEARLTYEEERNEMIMRLTEQWQKERAQLDEQHSESLQVLLEDEMLALVREHEKKESKLRDEWEIERAELQKHQEEALLRVAEERSQLYENWEHRSKSLKEEWQREKLQLEEDYEGMLQDRLMEEREKFDAEKEELEKMLKCLMEVQRAELEERHGDVIQGLTARHTKEREALSRLLDKLRDEVAQERSEASHLAEENHNLRQKINMLKEEDLKEARAQLLQTLEHLKTEKTAAETLANKFNKEISELRLRSQQLEDENERLSEENIQNVADRNKLKQQLAELTKEKNRREAFPAEEKTKLAACVSSLELTKALEEGVLLEERNTQLMQQLSNLREKVLKMDSLESHIGQLLEEQKNTNKETQLLRNQLAKAQERNCVMERALHSSGFQNPSKKWYRDEMSLLEKEQQLLRQENERLLAEVCSIKGELVHSREKVRHLDATILSLKQQKQQSQSCLLKALEQENASLKQELQAQKELTRGCEAQAGHTELESLQLENETLKSQMARMSTQLIESFQVQLAGLLPPSPHRMPRGQHRGEDLDNIQEREKKMKRMEVRMKEIEQSLHNVKLLLREKVAQLKAQLHKNGKADVLIKDLYVENSQLLKALERTEQRQQIAEKKNYLLEEKISSLNKIVRDLNPSSLSPLPYHYKCS
ncbi:ninein isoform X2 [Thalassophryne amazonica]|uniref:ninein isoform X2 n=1 Tax=Thalassophryne amazonica TaxID=390379 RepID=UPI0014713AB3|nr:ninein isoform X2 [Thalassophryne amazonica]